MSTRTRPDSSVMQDDDQHEGFTPSMEYLASTGAATGYNEPSRGPHGEPHQPSYQGATASTYGAVNGVEGRWEPPSWETNAMGSGQHYYAGDYAHRGYIPFDANPGSVPSTRPPEVFRTQPDATHHYWKQPPSSPSLRMGSDETTQAVSPPSAGSQEYPGQSIREESAGSEEYLVHERERLRCPYCGEFLTGPHAQGNLTRHQKSNKCGSSPNRRRFPCDVGGCGKSYMRSDALLNHKRNVHGAPGPVRDSEPFTGY